MLAGDDAVTVTRVCPTVAEIAFESIEVPASFVAVTVIEYVFVLLSPVITTGLPVKVVALVTGSE